MGSNSGRSKALRRLDERLSDVEGALQRHEARLVELRQVRERLLAERSLLTSSVEGEPAGVVLAANTGAPVVGAGQSDEAPDVVPAREHRRRLAALPREAAPVGHPAEGDAPERPNLGPGPLDPTQVWETFSSFRGARGPRVIYGRAVGEESGKVPDSADGELSPVQTG